jgi:hypothetical protein
LKDIAAIPLSNDIAAILERMDRRSADLAKDSAIRQAEREKRNAMLEKRNELFMATILGE